MEEEMKKIALTLSAALLLFGANEAVAQTVQGTATITIPTLLSIDVTNVSVTFPSPDLDDYTTGYVDMSSGTSVVSTRGNVQHDVTIAADAAAMTGPTAKPASDLQWGTGGSGGGFAGLSTSAADVATGLARGTNDAVAEVTYRMLLDEAADEPGTYSLAFTYTVVAN
jgi:hypothetical protein